MKDLEKARIFEAVMRAPGTTRNLIGKELSIRPTSVSHAINELSADSLLNEVRETLEQKQGRPEIHLFPAKNRFLVISVYISSRTLHAVLLNAFEEILSKAETHIEPEITNNEFLKKISKAAAELKSQVPHGSELLGLSLSVPGFMDTDKGIWIFTARWPQLRKLSFLDIEKAAGGSLRLTRVLDSALEYSIASDKKLQDQDTLLVHWGYGIGAAYANQGMVLSSNVGGVCEIGHWKVQSVNPEPCTCGSSGCLETVSSLRILLPILRREFPDLPEEEDLFIRYVKHNSRLVSHPAIRKAVDEMGRAVGTLFITLFPKTLLIYGALSSLPEIQKALILTIRKNIPDFAQDFLSVRFLPKGQQAALYGSARPLFREAYRKVLNAG